MTDNVTTYYLEMNSPDELRQAKGNVGHSEEDFCIYEAKVKQYEVNRFLYQFIGGAWDWKDKLNWNDDTWQEFAEAPNLRTWVAYVDASIAGYYELHRVDNDVEILYFGLAPRFIGQGLGGSMLTHAVTSAWNWGDVKRVWVHTCTLDHPSALENYKARGFKIYKEERSVQAD